MKNNFTEAVSFAGIGFILSFLSTLFGNTDIFDNSVNFQTALRIVQGQRLYQDFYIPNGPLAGLLLVPLARMLTPGWALLTSSCLLNASATFVVHRLLSRESVSQFQVRAGTLLTALWFLPPMGAFYHDHLAYFFVLCSLLGKMPGLFFALASHCKWTVGLPAFGVYVIFELVYSKSFIKPLRLLGVYLGSNAILMGLWCYCFGDGYLWATYILPAGYFGDFPQNLITITQTFFHSIIIPFRINPILMISELGWGRIIFFPVVVACYVCFFYFVKNKLSRDSKNLLLGQLIFTTLLGGSLLGRLHSHLFFGLGGALALTPIFSSRIGKTFFLILLCSGASMTLQGRGIFGPKLNLNNQNLYPLKINDSQQTRTMVEFALVISKVPQTSYYTTENSSSVITLLTGIAPVNRCQDYHIGTGIPANLEKRKDWQNKRIAEMIRGEVGFIVWSSWGERHMPLIGTFTKDVHSIKKFDAAKAAKIDRSFQLYERDPRDKLS